MRVVLAGGSGQVGTLLARRFHRDGHDVVVLSRTPRVAPWRTAAWDARARGPWISEVDGCDVLINLTGRNVNCRYTERNRRAILESRVRSTSIMREVVATCRRQPPVWLNASTATIYEHSLDRDMDEYTGAIRDATWPFSIEVATAWEEAFLEGSLPGTCRIALRSAMTMSPDPGGVFSVLSTLVRSGLGGPQGPGTQYVSWVHEADFLAAVDFLIARQDLQGPVNITSPSPLPNTQFMRILRKAWGVPFGLPATTWMLELGAAVLRTETELILKSRRVVPRRLLEAGFHFEFPEWDAAAEELVSRSRP